MVFGDNNNPNNHSIENSKSMNKQEGTLMSPPVNVFRISINGCEDNYVTLSDHNRIVADKDAEIARLRKELSERNNNMFPKDLIQGFVEQVINQQPSSNKSIDKPNKDSYHDANFYDNIDVPTLTKELILLSTKKRSLDKEVWIINSLKSWGIVCKILKDRNVFIGNNTNFCKYLLEEVFPNINNVKRKKALMNLKPSNVNHLPAAIKDKKVFEWKQEYAKNPNKKNFEECIVILSLIDKFIPKIKNKK